MKKVKVTCVIPSTLSPKVMPLLDACLKSLSIAAKKANFDIKTVIVTDNTDCDVEKLKINFSKIFYAGQKPGFAKVNNFAIAKTIKEPSDYYLLINDDAWVESDFFAAAAKIIRRVEPDIIVPLIYTREGPVIDSFGIEYFKSGYAKNAPTFDIETQLGAMACLLISRKLLIKMKKRFGFYLNEKLYSYLDDVEFSIRARGVGAKFVKDKSLKAHHMVSYTAGKKSYYVMYHTYRNILWVIAMTWPIKSILKNLASILIVQGWVVFYGLFSHGPFLAIKILFITLWHMPNLLRIRKTVLKGYDSDFDFSSVLANYTFRTYHGVLF